MEGETFNGWSAEASVRGRTSRVQKQRKFLPLKRKSRPECGEGKRVAMPNSPQLNDGLGRFAEGQSSKRTPGIAKGSHPGTWSRSKRGKSRIKTRGNQARKERRGARQGKDQVKGRPSNPRSKKTTKGRGKEASSGEEGGPCL